MVSRVQCSVLCAGSIVKTICPDAGLCDSVAAATRKAWQAGIAIANASARKAIARRDAFERGVGFDGEAVEAKRIFIFFGLNLTGRKAKSESSRGECSFDASSLPQVKIEEAAKQWWLRRKGSERALSHKSPAS